MKNKRGRKMGQIPRILLGTNIINTRKNYFYSKTLLPDKYGCMRWIGAKSNYGYGKVTIRYGHAISAHRFSYELHHGNFDKKMSVLHSCDNPLCVNPTHLFLGTQRDNMMDMFNKNRGAMKKGERYKFAPEMKGEKVWKAKLTEKQVLEIREKLKNGIEGKDIAKEYGVRPATISDINTGKNWKHI